MLDTESALRAGKRDWIILGSRKCDSSDSCATWGVFPGTAALPQSGPWVQKRIQGQSNGAKFVKETVVHTLGIGVGFPKGQRVTRI